MTLSQYIIAISAPSPQIAHAISDRRTCDQNFGLIAVDKEIGQTDEENNDIMKNMCNTLPYISIKYVTISHEIYKKETIYTTCISNVLIVYIYF